MTVLCVAALIAGDPVFDGAAIKRRGIEAHGLRVGEDEGEGIYIAGHKLAKDQARSIEDLHGVLAAPDR